MEVEDTRRRRARARARRSPALPIVLATLLGASLCAGLLVLTGATGGQASVTTTVTRGAAKLASDESTATSELDAESLYESVAAGVVEITSTVRSQSEAPMSPFGESQSSESTATGSGFVVDDRGDIVTAAHVVDEASAIKVTFQDGTTRSATLLGKDDASDIAVLKVNPSGLDLQPLQLASSASVNVGASVAAIGSPFEYAGSISTGIVSGLDRTIEAPNGFTVADAIQTDAAVNPGNSGGPLLDSEGEVIGVVDQIATDGSADQSSGVGFAVPSDLVASEIKALSNGEAVEHAYLGVATAASTESTQGALVQQVVAGGPAAKAGLKTGDIVTALDETAIEGSDDLVAAIAEHEPGDKVTLALQRGSESLKLTVRLETQPAQTAEIR